MNKKAYLEAVDLVCLHCSFTEEQCENCPVRIHVDNLCDDRLPKTYAEIEYTSEQLESDPIAIEGARWDDKNYQHYIER